MERRSLVAIAVLFLLLFLLERRLALRSSRRPLLGRLVVNASLSMLAFAIAALLVQPAVLETMAWASATPVGLLQLVPMPAAPQFALAFLLLDLTFYWWHVANHRIAFLWRFHNVHHIDPDLDVSTAFRFHAGEIALSTAFRVAQVAVVGPPVWMFAAYEVVFQACTMFHHSNLRLPIRLERLLALVLVTPRMHGIHHSQVRGETNSNYSVVFSWWDRAHRTLGLNIPQSQIRIGIAGYSDPADNRFWNALLLPFRRQRDYWRGPDHVVVERDRRMSGHPSSMLAE